MYVSGATMCLVLAVVFLPRNGRVGSRVYAAIIFVVLGELVLLRGAVSDLLLVALMYITAGLLLIAEIAAGGATPLIRLIWSGSGIFGLWKRNELSEWAADARPWVAIAGLAGALVLGALAALSQRRRNRPTYDPHDLIGI
jgi:hypothetical protein